MSDSIRVLVVDDAVFMRRSVIKLLRTASDVEIAGEASDGREAIAAFDALRPDVVCLDIDMPSMDGLTALKHIMSRRPTPVIVISSLTDRENVPFEALRLGVLDFFPKPSAQASDPEAHARQLLYLVRSARQVRLGNLRRVAVAHQDVRQPRRRSDHTVVIAGTIGSVSGFIRILSLLPPDPEGGISVLCQIPIHEAIVSSFVDSLKSYFGWEVERLSGLSPLRSGVATFVPRGFSIRFAGNRLELLPETSGSGLDSLFSACGERLGKKCSLLLLAGEHVEGLEGMRQAARSGAACFVQDEQTALFSSWAPALERTIGRFDLDHIIDFLGRTLAVGPVGPEA